MIWFCGCLAGLGATELHGEEGLRVLPGITMLKTGQWTLPYICGRPYLNKPPMINWLAALSFKITGRQDEWAARLPSALFTLLLPLVLLLLPSPSFTRNQRMLMALFFLTTSSVMDKGRLAEIEAVYVAVTGLAVYVWLSAWIGGRPWTAWLGSSLFLAMGMLTKGPMIVLFFYAVVLALIVSHRRWRSLLHPAHWLAVSLWLGLFGLWSSAASQYVDTDKMVSRWGLEMLIRFWPDQIDWPNRWEVWGRSLLLFMPWLLLFGLFWNKKALAAIEPHQRKSIRSIRNISAVLFVFIMLMPASEARYLMPLVPVSCILLGWLLPFQPPNSSQDQRLVSIMIVCAVLMPFVSVSLYIVTGYAHNLLWAPALSLLIALVALYLRPAISGTVPVFALLAVLIALGTMNYAVFRAHWLLPRQERKPWGLKINQQIPPNQTIYAFDPQEKIFLFYVREPLEYIIDPQQITPKVHYLIVPHRLLENPELHLIKTISDRMGRPIMSFNYQKNGGRFILYQLQ